MECSDVDCSAMECSGAVVCEGAGESKECRSEGECRGVQGSAGERRGVQRSAVGVELKESAGGVQGSAGECMREQWNMAVQEGG